NSINYYYILFLKNNIGFDYKSLKNKKKYILNNNFKYINNMHKYNLNLILNYNKILSKIKKITYFSFFYNKLKKLINDYFLFSFKNDFVVYSIINTNNHFLSTISFFDFKNDFDISKKNFFFVL